ncbi:hypothetical protein AHF37_10787 [Paragonimus kellicotti]|nr:hypothetical protein AHF37_10787 [Paragonimus kellicotti]
MSAQTRVLDALWNGPFHPTPHFGQQRIRIIEARFFMRDTLQPEPVLLQPDSEVQFESPDCVIEILESVDPKHLLISGQCFTSESHEFQREPSSFYMRTDVLPEELAKGFYLSPTTPRRIFLTTLSRTSMDDATLQYESGKLTFCCINTSLFTALMLITSPVHCLCVGPNAHDLNEDACI